MHDPKNREKFAVWAPSHNFVGIYVRNKGTYWQSEKKLVKQQYLTHMFLQYGELRSTSGEIVSLVWGTPANFNGFRVLAALLHTCTLVMGVSETLRRWAEGATYIRKDLHYVGHWPRF